MNDSVAHRKTEILSLIDTKAVPFLVVALGNELFGRDFRDLKASLYRAIINNYSLLTFYVNVPHNSVSLLQLFI